MHAYSLQATQEVHKPMRTTEVSICNSTESVCFLLLYQVDDELVLDRAQFVLADLTILTLLSGRQELLRAKKRTHLVSAVRRLLLAEFIMHMEFGTFNLGAIGRATMLKKFAD